jgi:parvulin-like peptidyl-prolyl isomerase
MSRTARFCLVLAAACVTGVMAAHFFCSSSTVRQALARWCGRGQLLFVVGDTAIYDCDLQRAELELKDRNPEASDKEIRLERKNLLLNFKLTRIARKERVSDDDVKRQLELMRFQFQPQSWIRALLSNGLSVHSLRGAISDNLRARAWLERKIAGTQSVEAAECSHYYKIHKDAYAQPLRLRASHIFFAAPPGSSPELVETKRASAQAIVDSLTGGAKFADLARSSEDEATKNCGGDLDFFSEIRMPADFWAAVKSMRPGDGPRLIQTQLGFHVLEVTDIRVARDMSFDAARPEIVLALQNQKRSLALTALIEDLSQDGIDGRDR